MAIGSTGNSDFPQGIWRNLYIHLPFCASKCGYCAFYSCTGAAAALRNRYLTALKEFLSRCIYTEKLETVYLGGGTPNFLTANELADLLEFVHDKLPLQSQCEISCELNPECLTESKLSVLNEYVTRLSLGVQSFDGNVRRTLMRRCSDEHLSAALKLLRRRKALHFNIDLIYGVADVPWSIFQSDMQNALDEGVDHLSCYALTPEENSLLGLTAPSADDNTAAEWWLKIGDFLDAQGLKRYEISNYAVPGGECRHNMNVWNGDTLLGVGAAASGFNGCDRYTFEADIESFIEKNSFTLDRTDALLRMLEIFAVKLRTAGGWNFEQWEKRYPGSWGNMKKLSERAAKGNPDWWQISDKQINLTSYGLLFWDDVAMDVLDWVEDIEK